MRQHHRIAQRRQQHRGADFDAGEAAGDRGEQRQWFMTRAGQDRIADPDGVEAEALGPRGPPVTPEGEPRIPA